MFHYRGCWGSEGDFGFATAPDDACAVMDELCSGRYHQVDASGFVLVGHSFGGWVAVLAAARDERVKACAVYGAAVEFHAREYSPDVIEQWFSPWLRGMTAEKFNRERLALPGSHQPLQQVARIAPRPLLVIHGGQDA